MRASALVVGFAVMFVSLGQAPVGAEKIKQEEIDYQAQTFQQWWGIEIDRRFADLPTEGKVPDYRIPYSGHDYPDRGGGTMAALRVYDRAFSNGRPVATEFERKDVRKRQRLRDRSSRGVATDYANRSSGANRIGGRFFNRDPDRPFFLAGLFGPRVPGWYGHCNGWTAAAIRHAEPQFSVTRNGVVFTPAVIKGMLAEIYMYTETEFLGGIDRAINPGTLHLTLANWLGRGSHPVGIETTLGEVAFNYPAYSYKSTSNKLSDGRVEVNTAVVYGTSTTYEYQQSPRHHKTIYFHYTLELDDKGQIVGGQYYRDSDMIDMAWTPLQPLQGGKKGNELGNPYLDIKEVLSIWRESVPKKLRDQWLNIDPTDEDRMLDENVAQKSAVKEGVVPAAAAETAEENEGSEASQE